MNRPGQRVGLPVAFQHGDGNPGVGEQEGRGTPGRPGTDDDDGLGVRGAVVVHGHGPFLRVISRRSGAVAGPQRTVRANPATASRTRSGSAPVTARTSRPSSCAAVTWAPARAAASSASLT